MNRRHISLLVLTLFVSQILLVAHLASHYDKGQLCEICVVAGQQGHAIVSTPLWVFQPSDFISQTVELKTGVSQFVQQPYQVRAPPQLL